VTNARNVIDQFDGDGHGREFALQEAYIGRTIHGHVELLEVAVRRFPERIALSGPEASITYAELWRAVTGLAEQIAGATAPGDLVGVLAPVSPAFPTAMLACFAAGRPFVPLDPDYPQEWIAQVLDDSRPALLVVSNADHGTPGGISTVNENGTPTSEDGALMSPSGFGRKAGIRR
jgi:acyl-CoA synthetase (AMP-forming)/AMP-acid ligase II